MSASEPMPQRAVPTSHPPWPQLSGPPSVAMSTSDSTAIRLLCLSYADASVSSLTSTGHVSFFGLFICPFFSFIHQAFHLYVAGTGPQR